ncbi:linear amide C-N hydrolase [Chromobacterium sp. IIBBL 290-4]|uniref:linear amide C-N hydrolase n=1 Tax=Chromobacterium sp. IIBBL 290-4 TaxID=2953890 RepID=UPI0020B65C18|nr:choloylglycine hydrolase family protein [Chromobacterium sp. IIBBL 290-4]UTH74824.1 choloylglycine hydrolase family protein [Chromobacterium sp. IIBBL 290-4]
MCTHFQIRSADGNHVVGRSMEFAQSLAPAFYIQRRGQPYRQPSGAHELLGQLAGGPGWTAEYGYVGISSTNLPLKALSERIVTDGMNEAGLSVGLLWLPGTVYQPFGDLQNTVLAPLLADWLLGNCGSIAEVKAKLPTRHFWFPALLASQLPLHASVVDKTGAAVVIEFQNGEQKIHDNPVGVCTNAPWFPWHLDNLGNYVNLTPNDPKSQTLGSLSVSSPGHGGGLAGLPGNATPPSRFVRAAYLKQYADTPANVQDAYTLATHLLNSVDIPRGTIRDGNDQDYTQWAVVKGLNTGEFGIRTYQSMQYFGLKLKDIDFATVESQVIPVPALSDITFTQPK